MSKYTPIELKPEYSTGVVIREFWSKKYISNPLPDPDKTAEYLIGVFNDLK